MGIKKIIKVLILFLGIYLITGVFQPEGKRKPFVSFSGPRGNGKTASLVKYGVQELRKAPDSTIVLSNFKTSSPALKPFTKVMSFKEMMRFCERNKEEIQRRNLKIVILLTEGWNVLSRYMSVDDELEAKEFLNQVRKINATLYIDTQRNMDLPPILRDALSGSYTPYKIHDDESICTDEHCMKHHYIIVNKIVLDKTGHWRAIIVDRFDIDTVKPYYNTKDCYPVDEPGGVLA